MPLHTRRLLLVVKTAPLPPRLTAGKIDPPTTINFGSSWAHCKASAQEKTARAIAGRFGLLLSD
jgi:hypothetical protein